MLSLRRRPAGTTDAATPGSDSADVATPEDPTKPAHGAPIRPSVVMPITFAVFGLLYLESVKDLSWQSKGYGVAAASLLVLVSVVGLGLEVRRLARTREAARDTTEKRRGRWLAQLAMRFDWSHRTALLAIGLLIAAVYLAKQVGLYPVFAVYLPVQMWLLRERNPIVLLTVDAGTLSVFYLVFVHFLKMDLPLW